MDAYFRMAWKHKLNYITLYQRILLFNSFKELSKKFWPQKREKIRLIKRKKYKRNKIKKKKEKNGYYHLQ